MKTISKNELVSKMGTSGEVVVNVLESPSYEKIHIKGSISVPLSQLKAGRWSELDRTKEIVTHCSSYTCDASREGAEFLEAKGFNVRAYEGGMREWAESKLPTEGKYTPEQYLEEKYGKPKPTAKVV